ncbi:MAG: LysR family transcriptional regulator [Synergistaceae bacterium]|nr:LysR family transcriptional regulator [Synergistaceae bacterium]
MIDTYLLKCLVTFARCGTLTAASQELYVSQPALSRSMQKLEDVFKVRLFERRKNKITLNQSGILAAELAGLILQDMDSMVDKVRFFERSQHTISIGCCASVPYREMIALISTLYPEMNINSELKSDTQLLEGLYDGNYQLVVLHEQPHDEKLYCKHCGHEQIYISLPPEHSLSSREGIYPDELNGQTMLLYSAIGFWHDLCAEKMPDSKFLLQNDFDVFTEIADASAFPVFTSSFYLQRGEKIAGRVSIPILDSEFSADYWCVCRISDREKFKPVFAKLPVKSMAETRLGG